MLTKRPALLSLWLTLLLVLLPACGNSGATAPAATTAPASTEAPATSAPASTDAPAATEAAPAATTAATEAAAATGEPLTLIATFSVLGDLVQNVAGDAATVRTLVGPGGDAHVYEPAPSDSAALAEADLLFENGLEFEPWLDDMYSASGSQATRVVVTEQVTPLAVAEGEGHGHSDEAHSDEAHSDEAHSDEAHSDEAHSDEAHSDEAHSDEAHSDEAHSHGEYDPHVWNDPNNAVLMVETIRDALVAADSANAATYEANASAYIAQLQELDTFIKQETDQLPAEQRKLVTTHDTFGYFAERYGYEVVGTALGSVSTEVADPAAGEVAELITEIREAGVPAIFAESSNNAQLMERIAQEADVTLAPELYPESLSEEGGPAATYLDMVRYNVTTIVTALAG
jgi:zinc/manganese transport system substrate-binding protein